jgi:hypothetical protein
MAHIVKIDLQNFGVDYFWETAIRETEKEMGEYN